ncbi:acidic leucine-rich nuclear phosphoprotein 32 family member A [Tanacetum coccineum]
MSELRYLRMNSGSHTPVMGNLYKYKAQSVVLKEDYLCSSDVNAFEIARGSLGIAGLIGISAHMLTISLMGETVRPLPLACEWEEIPEAYKAHIYPTLESYFNLAEWYNKQDKVVVDRNVYTVGERVRLGLELKLRLLWRKNKNRIKADHYAKHTSPDEAKNHPPPPKVWGERTQDDWNELVDWWSQPDRVSRSLQNAANRAKNTIITHQGKKSFAQGRNEYKVTKGITRTSLKRGGRGTQIRRLAKFKTPKKRAENMQSAHPVSKTADQEKLDETVPSDNAEMSVLISWQEDYGWFGSTSRRRANRAFGDIMTQDQITQMFRQQEQVTIPQIVHMGIRLKDVAGTFGLRIRTRGDTISGVENVTITVVEVIIGDGSDRK